MNPESRKRISAADAPSLAPRAFMFRSLASRASFWPSASHHHHVGILAGRSWIDAGLALGPSCVPRRRGLSQKTAVNNIHIFLSCIFLSTISCKRLAGAGCRLAITDDTNRRPQRTPKARRSRSHEWNTEQTRVPFRVQSVLHPWRRAGQALKAHYSMLNAHGSKHSHAFQSVFKAFSKQFQSVFQAVP